jgi:hypothetical protein
MRVVLAREFAHIILDVCAPFENLRGAGDRRGLDEGVRQYFVPHPVRNFVTLNPFFELAKGAGQVTVEDFSGIVPHHACFVIGMVRVVGAVVDHQRLPLHRLFEILGPRLYGTISRSRAADFVELGNELIEFAIDQYALLLLGGGQLIEGGGQLIEFAIDQFLLIADALVDRPQHVKLVLIEGPFCPQGFH